MNEVLSEIDILNKRNKWLNLVVDTLEEKEQLCVISLIGHLDTLSSQSFVECISKIIKNKKTIRKFVFNLSKLTYISSSGIAAFITILKDTKLLNKELFLYKIENKVAMVFETLGFLSVFNIISSLDVIT